MTAKFDINFFVVSFFGLFSLSKSRDIPINILTRLKAAYASNVKANDRSKANGSDASKFVEIVPGAANTFRIPDTKSIVDTGFPNIKSVALFLNPNSMPISKMRNIWIGNV